MSILLTENRYLGLPKNVLYFFLYSEIKHVTGGIGTRKKFYLFRAIWEKLSFNLLLKLFFTIHSFNHLTQKSKIIISYFEKVTFGRLLSNCLKGFARRKYDFRKNVNSIKSFYNQIKRFKVNHFYKCNRINMKSFLIV